MYFKRLEMHGFKSFAEPVVIDFHEGITAIVGPNGSGKSNISDAIRWVLGEQSPKALRGGKMEEVIFAGTASRKSRGMAEVTLVIDNSTGILEIDYNEVAITRRMYRSGESEYLINNNQCRLRDIRELIMDTGIGVDGYSLIGQGKIADIVSNKPDSRREIFEEAAGVVMYKSKKAEAERKLATANNNLERVDDIVGEIESRIDTLKEDSEKATEYLALKERYRDLEINITLKNIETASSKNDEFKTDIEGLTKKIDEISVKKREIDDSVSSDREKSESLEQLSNEKRDKLLKIVEDINILTNKSQLNDEKLAGIEKDKTRLDDEIKDLSERLERENENKQELDKSKHEITVKFEEAKVNLQDTAEKYSTVSSEAATISQKIEEGKSQLFDLHTKVSSMTSEIKSFDSIKDTLSKRQSQIEAELTEAKENSEKNSEALKGAQEEETLLKEQSNKVNSALAELTSEEEKLIAKRKELNVQIEDLKINGGQKTARKKTIEEMENNYEGYNYAVKYIMKSSLRGIEGVVAELMEVPSGYEVAIETALGGQMQNIICDTDDNAKFAVNMLKKNQAGRLTFLPISSIKGSKANIDSRILNADGFVGVASDCINFNPSHKAVFEYLLGRVVITRDMDSAIRMSKIAGNGIRFVTFDGEIINASGAITGGKFKNKTANILERKAEIQKLGDEIEILRNEITVANQTYREAIDRLEKIAVEKKAFTEEGRSLDIKLAGLVSTIKALTSESENMDSENHKYSRELLSIDTQLADAKRNEIDLQEKIEESNEQIALINADLEELMEVYESKKENVSAASEEITKSRIAATEWENKLDNAQELGKRLEETISDYELQLSSKKNQLEKLEDEKNQIFFGSEGTEDNVKALMAEKEETESYIESVKVERAEIIEKLSHISKEQEEMLGRLNSYQDQKYQLEIKQAKNESQLDTLKDKLWEDFEISYAQALDFKREDFVLSTSVRESREIRNRMRELGDVNVGSIKEYAEVSQRYKFLTEQRADAIQSINDLKSIISDMDNTIKTKFKENFDQVVVNFESIFKDLFGGGFAELRMEDENNPLESGIEIVAQPPGKKLQNINLMSGGEKTMTAIALMFAVLKTKPTPFCILDEVEAALDDNNIERFSKYLRKFNDIQFALVTHQKATMEHADVMYGVTMPEQGVSKVLSLRLGDSFEL